jgi:hypothetical protein
MENEKISVVDLIDSGLHNNKVAYALAKALLDVSSTMRSVNFVADLNVSNGDDTLNAEVVGKWMSEMHSVASKAVTEAIK